MTPPITCRLSLNASPLLDAIRTYVPAGGSMAMSVGIDAVPPCGGIVISGIDALDISIPMD